MHVQAKAMPAKLKQVNLKARGAQNVWVERGCCGAETK
jgi:hypothetical protein